MIFEDAINKINNTHNNIKTNSGDKQHTQTYKPAFGEFSEMGKVALKSRIGNYVFPFSNYGGSNERGKPVHFFDVLGQNNNPIRRHETLNGFYVKSYTVSNDEYRNIARTIGLVQSIINYKTQLVLPYLVPSEDEFRKGFVFNSKKKLDDKKELIANLFVQRCGKIYHGEKYYHEQEDIQSFITKIIKDLLVLGYCSVRIRYDRDGNVREFFALDAGTIYRVTDKFSLPEDAEEKVKEQGRKLKSNNKTVKYVQAINRTMITNLYTDEDIIFMQYNPDSDIQNAIYGYSPLEQAINSITPYINILNYNIDYFTEGATPKVILTQKGGNGTEIDSDLQTQNNEKMSEFMNALNDQLTSNKWHIPYLPSDIEIKSLASSPRDMEFKQYINELGSTICSVFGVDPVEIGKKYEDSANVSFDSKVGTIQNSKNDTVFYLLNGYVAKVINMIMGRDKRFFDVQDSIFMPRFVFQFTGMKGESEFERLDILKKKSEIGMTVNEIREEMDLKPLKDDKIENAGDMPNSQIFSTNYNSLQAQQQQEGEEMEDEESFNDDFDEAYGEEFGENEEIGEDEFKSIQRSVLLK